MALTVTPTSGAAPYTLEIDLAHKNRIDGVEYELVARQQLGTGMCNVPTNTPNEVIRNALLTDGVYVRTNGVGNNQCLVFKVDIVYLPTDEIISTQSVTVDNLV